MPSALAPVLTFLAVFLALVSVYSLLADLWLRERSRVGARIDKEFQQRQREFVKKSALFKNLNQLASGAADEETSAGWRRRLEVLLEQADLNWSPRVFLAATASCAVGVGLLSGLLRQSVLVGLGCALTAAVLPLFYVHRRRWGRLEQMQSQLPDAFDTMARVLRAGQTLTQAQQAVAKEFRPPLGLEFLLCQEQQNLGLSWEEALRDLARRTGLLELKICVMAILVQQQTGGSLAELLERLAGVVRERYRMRGRIKTLTAEGRLQALVLIALPPLLFVALLILKRDYAQILLDHPWLLAGTVASQVIGALWIRRLISPRM